jgi:hypothetical protein
MATGCGKDLNRTRFGTLGHAGQVTDDAAGALRKGQLDRQVQLLDDVVEASGNLKDGYLTYRACSDPSPRCRLWMGSWLRWELSRDVGRVTGRERDDSVVEICVMVLSAGRLVLHDGLDSVVLERKDTGHRGSGVARKQVVTTKVWSGRNVRDATPRRLANPKFDSTAAELRTEQSPDHQR